MDNDKELLDTLTKALIRYKLEEEIVGYKLIEETKGYKIIEIDEENENVQLTVAR